MEEKLQRFCLTGVEPTGKDIGRGPYCTVHQLKFRGLACAGKKITKLFEAEEREKFLERFHEECSLLDKLRHPNIVQFMGVVLEERDVVPTLVIEYMEGGSLAGWVEQHGGMGEGRVGPILKDVACGLSYLHGNQPPTSHGHLTANNVLLDKYLQAKISDTGMAKLLGVPPTDVAMLTTCPGIPAYMAPEAIKGPESCDISHDIFAMGVMAIHALSGDWPLPTMPTKLNPTSSLIVEVSEYERRMKYIKRIPTECTLLELIKLCLSNDPSNRPSAGDILDSLAHFNPFDPTSDGKSNEGLQRELEETTSKLKDLVLEKEQVDAMTTLLTQQLKDKDREIEILQRAKVEEPKVQPSAPPMSMIQFQWERCNNFPVAASKLKCEYVNCQLYVGGGHSDDINIRRGLFASSNITSAATPKQDWQVLTPTPLIAFGMTQMDGDLLLVGGKRIPGVQANRAFVSKYDLKTGELGHAPYAPVPQETTTSGTVNMFNIYLVVVGGIDCTTGGITNACYAYDKCNAIWLTLPNLPIPVYSCHCICLSDKIYVMGGYSSMSPLTPNQEVYCLTWEATAWERLCVVPYQYSAFTSFGGSLMSICGCTASGVWVTSVELYSERSRCWIKVGDFPEAILGGAAATLPTGEIIVVGGTMKGKTKSCKVYKGKPVF